ncbi:cold-shock protein [Shinella sp.]|uniref:cold-shock protein n=1 Tax=unclassified Shinella TaxID=2643062 RepID=UPI0028B15D9D|nr:cold-shock protein [Shinella sp.]
MSRKTYATGDHIVLKAGLSRKTTEERSCRIVGVLPNDHGEVQYRVRLDGETFERRIVQSDIDAEETAAPSPKKSATVSTAGKAGPWLKPLNIRSGK